MIDPAGIHALSDFQRNAKKHLARLKKTGLPEVLTVNGKAAAVVQNPEAYVKLAELAHEAREARLLREAIEEAKTGRGRPFREVINELRANHKPRVRRKSA